MSSNKRELEVVHQAQAGVANDRVGTFCQCGFVSLQRVVNRHDHDCFRERPIMTDGDGDWMAAGAEDIAHSALFYDLAPTLT